MTGPTPDAATPGAPAPSLDADEVRRRASAGLIVVGMRGLMIAALGLASNVVLARLLTPRDFGVAAAGLTFIAFVGLLSDGGLGGGLIRRPEPPTVPELRALLGLQLVVTIVLAAAIGAVAVPLGEGGRVVALMVCAMPLVALQFPGKIQLERELRYRPLALVEVSQVLAYQASAIVLVALGAGVWGLAYGWFARAITGAIVTNVVSPVRVLRPSLSWTRVRALVRFGVQFQLVSATGLARDQGLNAVVGTVGGIGTLGLYTLAKRLLEVPFLVLTTVFRISMPAMSQLIAAREEPGRLIERALSVASVGTGVGLVMLAGSGPGLVPGVFGAEWTPAASVLPGACLALYLSGSIAISTQGFLYAVGDAGAVLRATLVAAVVALGVTAALLPSLGTWAAGLGLLAASGFEAALLIRSTNRHIRADIVGIMTVPLLIATVAMGAGWAVADVAGPTLLSGAAGAAAALAVFLAGFTVTRPAEVPAFVRMVRRAVGNARRGPAPATS